MYLYLCFDLCAVVVMITLIMALIIRKLTKGRSNRLFLLFCITTLITGIVDIGAEYYDKLPNYTERYTMLKYLLDYAYFAIHNLATPLYVLFSYSILGLWKKVAKRGATQLFCFGMYAFVIISLVANVFTGKLFYFDALHAYHRGQYFIVLYIVAVAYLIMGAYALIKYRYLITPIKYIVLISCIPFTVIALAIQAIFSQFRIEIFAMAIISVVVSIMVLRPEDMMDSVVEMQSYNAFLQATKNSFLAKNEASYLFIRIINNKNLRSNLGIGKYIQLLQKVASKIERISKVMNIHCEIYYLDGGSFALVSSIDDYDELLDAGRTILAYLMEPLKIDQMEVMVEARECIVNCPEDISSDELLINFANTFHHKLPNDKRVICLSQIAKTKDFRMRNEIDSIISKGISERKFQMYYQPIYSTVKKKFVSAEALIRLNDDKFGFVSPAIFIPAAEESGAIHDIGDFVLEDVCRFIGSNDFKKLGLEYIEINLSVAQCIEQNLFEKIDGYMKKYGVRPEQINLEITETSADYAPEITDRNIALLSEAGITFSLDDYGTGYSNIARIVKLPLDIVKLDKCLVDDMDSPLMWIVIKNTVDMLKRMNKKILVEGIEDERALGKFEAIGCDYIQGFYFSKPLPENSFLDFVRGKNLGMEI